LGLITIATDDDAVADARRVVRGGRLRCPHLSDRRGTVAALFDAREPSFNAFLLDSTGVVRWRRHDHPPDLQAMFEEIEGLVQGGEEAPRGR
jgi:hypothetical protein